MPPNARHPAAVLIRPPHPARDWPKEHVDGRVLLTLLGSAGQVHHSLLLTGIQMVTSLVQSLLPSTEAPRQGLAALAAIVIVLACLPGVASEVSPQEIPELEAQIADKPNDGRLLLRYSAALFAAGRCDSATVVSRRGGDLRPGDALGPLVIGQCLEQSGDYNQAIATYTAFTEAHGDS